MTETKVCSVCGDEKPLDYFYLLGYRKTDNGARYSRRCRQCVNARSVQSAKANGPKKLRPTRAMLAEQRRLEGEKPTKKCRTCGEDKPASEFYVKRTLVSGAILYRPDCMACDRAAIASDPEERERIRAASAAWRAEDPDRAKKSLRDAHAKHRDKRNAAKHERRMNPLTRPIVLESARRSVRKYAARRQVDARVYRIKNIEKIKAYLRAYWKANPAKASEYRSRRRALLLGASGTHTAADIADIRRMQGDRCANPACKCKLHGKGQADHRVALSKGGSNDRRNLQILCDSCNGAKKAKDEITFMQSLGFLL